MKVFSQVKLLSDKVKILLDYCHSHTDRRR